MPDAAGSACHPRPSERNEADGLDAFHAVVEATVQRAGPVILPALYALWYRITPGGAPGIEPASAHPIYA